MSFVKSFIEDSTNLLFAKIAIEDFLTSGTDLHSVSSLDEQRRFIVNKGNEELACNVVTEDNK